MVARSPTMASHNDYFSAARPQAAPSRGRGNSFGANEPTANSSHGPTADPTALSSPSAKPPSARSFDMARLSRPAHLEDVLDMDVGSFRVPSLHRSPSAGSGLSRGNTLKGQKSLSRRSSLRRSSSAHSMRAGSASGVVYENRHAVDQNNVFYTPVPTSGSPTEVLANRFQGMFLRNGCQAGAYSCSSLEKVPKGPYWLLQGGPVVIRATI